MSRPVRVLYFIQDLTTGGSESHLARLLVHLDRKRVSPALMLFQARGALLADVQATGLSVYDTRYRHGLTGMLALRRRFRAIVDEWRPDVVHAYGYPCDVFATLFSLPRKGVRIVTSRRGNEPFWRLRMLYRLTNPLVDRVACVSGATQDYAVRTEGLSRRRSVVIANGIDLSAFTQVRRSRERLSVIGALGRLRPVKGMDLLLEAFDRLRDRGVTLKLGGPADRAWGVALRSRYENQPGILFLDDVNPSNFFEEIDLFVLPSRSEGMSNALLEAMAAGLPIVATDVGGNREVLAHGEAGVLVKPDAESIADGIAQLLDDPAGAERLAGEARRRVEAHYTLAEMVRNYERFYEGLVRSA